MSSRDLFGFPRIQKHSINVYGSTTNGSTGNRCRVYTNIDYIFGTAITYVRSSVDGDSFKINENGIYDISSTTSPVGTVDTAGIAKNTAGSVQIQNVADANVLALATSSASNEPNCVSWCGYLKAGDTIRVHHDSATVGSSRFQHFTITQILPVD